MTEADHRWLRMTFDVARRAREHGNTPFGSILVGPNDELLLEGENTFQTSGDITGHAETNVVREAVKRFDRETLARSTIYASTEPCAMCGATIYLAGIGRVVFGLRAARLREMFGTDPANPPLLITGSDVLRQGGRAVEVVGPVLEEEAEQVHRA